MIKKSGRKKEHWHFLELTLISLCHPPRKTHRRYTRLEGDFSVKDQPLILQMGKLRGKETASTLTVIEPD